MLMLDSIWASCEHTSDRDKRAAAAINAVKFKPWRFNGPAYISCRQLNGDTASDANNFKTTGVGRVNTASRNAMCGESRSDG